MTDWLWPDLPTGGFEKVGSNPPKLFGCILEFQRIDSEPLHVRLTLIRAEVLVAVGLMVPGGSKYFRAEEMFGQYDVAINRIKFALTYIQSFIASFRRRVNSFR